MFDIMDYFVGDESAIRAVLWGERPKILAQENYLLIESPTRPASLTVFSYNLKDLYPQIIESNTGFKFRPNFRRKVQSDSTRPFSPWWQINQVPLTMKDFLSNVYAQQKRNKPRSQEVRIRTWAIYRLSKRGGGTRSEQSALQLWSDHYQGGLEIGETELKLFQRDRDALLLTQKVQQHLKGMQESRKI